MRAMKNPPPIAPVMIPMGISTGAIGGGCLLGPLCVRAKPIGIIVADHGADGRLITPEDFSAFVLVIGQVNVNLSRLAKAGDAQHS